MRHHDVIKWKHFPRYSPFVRGIHRSPGNSPHTGQWRGALMFSLICAWINGWANSGEAGDLRNHRAHQNVTVMIICKDGVMIWYISQKNCFQIVFTILNYVFEYTFFTSSVFRSPQRSSVCYNWFCFTFSKRNKHLRNEFVALRWRHNGLDSVSNHQPRDCLLNRSFGCRSK